MKRLFCALCCAFILAGCSSKGWEEQTTEPTQEGVSVYNSDRGTSYDLEVLPFEMDYNNEVIEFISCELYQEYNDYEYRPYVVAKINISKLSNEDLHWLDEDLYVASTVTNESNELIGYDLYKICEIDEGEYRYYVYSELELSDGYRNDFSNGRYSFTFGLSQKDKVKYEINEKEYTDNREMTYRYFGSTGDSVKELKNIGDSLWLEIKDCQLKRLTW